MKEPYISPIFSAKRALKAARSTGFVDILPDQLKQRGSETKRTDCDQAECKVYQTEMDLLVMKLRVDLALIIN